MTQADHDLIDTYAVKVEMSISKVLSTVVIAFIKQIEKEERDFMKEELRKPYERKEEPE